MELRGLNLQFNIQSRLAIFSKWSTIHITGFLGKVFESAAADKWPEVTRRITWSWWPSPSVFAYCKRSKTGGVEGLGTRLAPTLPPYARGLVLRLIICCAFVWDLCVRTYHVRNNYVTYIVAMRPCFSRIRQFRWLLCVVTMSSVATMSSLAQLRVRDGYWEAEAT